MDPLASTITRSIMRRGVGNLNHRSVMRVTTDKKSPGN